MIKIKCKKKGSRKDRKAKSIKIQKKKIHDPALVHVFTQHALSKLSLSASCVPCVILSAGHAAVKQSAYFQGTYTLVSSLLESQLIACALEVTCSML